MFGPNETKVPIDKKNNVIVRVSSDYPVCDSAVIFINPAAPVSMTLSVRIPVWSSKTTVLLNGKSMGDAEAGSYKKITRVWSASDKVVIRFDMTGRLVKLNNCQAIIRGPIVLARDSRFKDGFIYESAVVRDDKGKVELTPASEKSANTWMTFKAPLVLGTDLEGEFRNPRQIQFCDFASAGNTWSEDSRYRVWIPSTLNVMKSDYKGY
jgi:DUF1680 family protein